MSCTVSGVWSMRWLAMSTRRGAYRARSWAAEHTHTGFMLNSNVRYFAGEILGKKSAISQTYLLFICLTSSDFFLNHTDRMSAACVVCVCGISTDDHISDQLQ